MCPQVRASAAEEKLSALQEQHDALCEKLRDAVASVDAMHKQVHSHASVSPASVQHL